MILNKILVEIENEIECLETEGDLNQKKMILLLIKEFIIEQMETSK